MECVACVVIIPALSRFGRYIVHQDHQQQHHQDHQQHHHHQHDDQGEDLQRDVPGRRACLRSRRSHTLGHCKGCHDDDDDDDDDDGGDDEDYSDGDDDAVILWA